MHTNHTNRIIHPNKKSNLPYKTEHFFVGREQEMRELIQAIESNFQIVSIVGTPGIGKSTLAIHVGHEMHKRGMVIQYVDLYEISSLSSVKDEILRRVGFQTRITSVEQLLLWAGEIDTATLLILDNCDNVLHASSKFQNLVLSIVEESKFLKVILSAKRLPIFTGRNFYKLPLRELGSAHAIELLQKLSQNLTIEECHRITDLVGRMPMALQVIGALLHFPLPPNATTIIANLQKDPISLLSPGELPEIQQIQTSISVSYTYLSNHCQLTARYLANFPASFTKDAAEAVIEPLQKSIHFDTQRCISVLLQRSLLIHNSITNRLQFHRLIKEYFIHIQKSLGKKGLLEISVFWIKFRSYYLNTVIRPVYTPLNQPPSLKDRWSVLDSERQNLNALWESPPVSTPLLKRKEFMYNFSFSSLPEAILTTLVQMHPFKIIIDMCKATKQVALTTYLQDDSSLQKVINELDYHTNLKHWQSYWQQVADVIQMHMLHIDCLYDLMSAEIGRERAINHFTNTLLAWHRMGSWSATTTIPAAEILESRQARVLELYSHISNSITRKNLYIKFYSALATAYIQANRHMKFMECWREILHHKRPLKFCERKKCSDLYLGLAYYGLKMYEDCIHHLEAAWRTAAGSLTIKGQYLVVLYHAYDITGDRTKAHNIVDDIENVTIELLINDGINFKTYKTGAILASFFEHVKTSQSKELAKYLKRKVMQYIMIPKTPSGKFFSYRLSQIALYFELADKGGIPKSMVEHISKDLENMWEVLSSLKYPKFSTNT